MRLGPSATACIPRSVQCASMMYVVMLPPVRFELSVCIAEAERGTRRCSSSTTCASTRARLVTDWAQANHHRIELFYPPRRWCTDTPDIEKIQRFTANGV